MERDTRKVERRHIETDKEREREWRENKLKRKKTQKIQNNSQKSASTPARREEKKKKNTTAMRKEAVFN